MIFQIVILAMIAAFLGLRLYAVLGRRAEHEEEAVPTRFDQGEDRPAERAAAPTPAPALPRELIGAGPAVEQGLRQIAAADRGFDVATFVDGAKGAYAMILEAFWRGDRETLAQLCAADVYDSFVAVIEDREAAGEVLDNRLVRIEEATVRSAGMEGRQARVTLNFVADIAAVTRDASGEMVAGSLDDAIESRDVWTFGRDVSAAGPDWQLIETDEG